MSTFKRGARTILPISLLLSSTSVFAQTGPWTVSEVSGPVVIRSEAGERVAERGARVAAGQQVVTRRNGNAVLVRGNEFVTVRPNTRITIAPENRERSVVQMIQDFGSAIFNIGKQPDPLFGVDTPYLAAVVKGTTFSITVTDGGAAMQVTEGAVEAATLDGGAVDLVRPGEVAMIASDDRFRLSIEGDVSRQIDSPERGVAAQVTSQAPAVTSSSPSSNALAAPSSVQANLDQARPIPDSTASAGRPVVIRAAVTSDTSNLGELTGGLVSGEVVAVGGAGSEFDDVADEDRADEDRVEDDAENTVALERNLRVEEETDRTTAEEVEPEPET